MSDAEFHSELDAVLKQLASCQQRGKLLDSFKQKMADLLDEFGSSQEGPATQKAEVKPEPKVETKAATPPPAVQKAADDQPRTGGRRAIQAPGGSSSVALGGEATGPSEERHSRKKIIQPAGGSSSIIFGDDSAKKEHTSVHVAQPSGGKSSIQLGGDENSGQVRSSVHVAQPSGGKSSIQFGAEDNSQTKSSTRRIAPPGGASNMVLGSAAAAAPAPAAAAAAPASSSSEELSLAELKEIGAAVSRRGKTKDTFLKFTANKTKNLFPPELKAGIESLGLSMTDAQAVWFVNKFAKDAKEGLSNSDFTRFLSYSG